MTAPENEKPLWNEAQVESLLEDFFQKEMPRDLQCESPELSRAKATTPASLTRPVVANSRPRSVAGILVVGLSSLLMVMVALLYEDPTPSPGITPDGVAAPGTVEKRIDRSVDLLNPDGPVELRPGVHPVRQGNPDEAMEFPELDIEIFPPEPNVSDPEKPTDHPLPEQNRALPENRLPEEKDPDEADDAVLPELQSQPFELF